MKFGIITHAVHKIDDKKIYAYEPYVREMNLWAKHVDEIIILAPITKCEVSSIDINYVHNKIKVEKIPNFNITNFKNLLITILIIPKTCWRIFKVMKQVNHIHLRCPGNVGLIGCFIQVFFPKKIKTVKYAGNWDPESKQPFSYKLQKWIISNTFLTRNCKVLVYGKWENQSKNIIPFFTASYKKNEIELIEKKDFSTIIKFMFVGTFSVGKQPFLSVKIIESLILKGFNVQLNMYGNGTEFLKIKEYVKNKSLEKVIILHGNQPRNIVKEAYKISHFLLFISKSEGWPKVVAEAMFWKCLPISSNVSCINYMLGNKTRGSVLKANVNVDNVVVEIQSYLTNENIYQKKVINAEKWSQNYTLDKFSNEIKRLLNV